MELLLLIVFVHAQSTNKAFHEEWEGQTAQFGEAKKTTDLIIWIDNKNHNYKLDTCLDLACSFSVVGYKASYFHNNWTQSSLLHNYKSLHLRPWGQTHIVSPTSLMDWVNSAPAAAS